jgi:hypothetical protein
MASRVHSLPRLWLPKLPKKVIVCRFTRTVSVVVAEHEPTRGLPVSVCRGVRVPAGLLPRPGGRGPCREVQQEDGAHCHVVPHWVAGQAAPIREAAPARAAELRWPSSVGSGLRGRAGSRARGVGGVAPAWLGRFSAQGRRLGYDGARSRRERHRSRIARRGPGRRSTWGASSGSGCGPDGRSGSG